MRDTTSGDVPFLLYHFRSSFSHQWYIVRVEEYPNDFYGVKFYLKTDKLNPHKYNRLTGLNEPRPVINTCIAILLEIGQQNLRASFGFIGANMINEGMTETKRFCVYRRILTTYFSEEVFYHYQMKEQSAYALIRRSVLDANPQIVDNLNDYFSKHYSNFD